MGGVTVISSFELHLSRTLRKKGVGSTGHHQLVWLCQYNPPHSYSERVVTEQTDTSQRQKYHQARFQ